MRSSAVLRTCSSAIRGHRQIPPGAAPRDTNLPQRQRGYPKCANYANISSRCGFHGVEEGRTAVQACVLPQINGNAKFPS
jgi:hypothetical protein